MRAAISQSAAQIEDQPPGRASPRQPVFFSVTSAFWPAQRPERKIAGDPPLPPLARNGAMVASAARERQDVTSERTRLAHRAIHDATGCSLPDESRSMLCGVCADWRKA